MKMLLGISTVLSLVSVAAWAEPMYGVLMVVKGSVKVQNASKQTTDAKVGGKVAEGDTVITAADSRAKIVMSDRNVINVNPDTQVQIAKYENDAASGKKNVEMNLLQGKVRNNVEQTYDGEKNKFLIKTPTAVAGVRGTQFLAGFDVKTKMTSIVTFKGAVTLASIGANGALGPSVTVKKGQMTTAAPDKAPEAPKNVPKEDMKKMDGESTASMSNKETKSSEGGEQKREVASEGGKEGGKDAEKKSPPPDEPKMRMTDNVDLDPKPIPTPMGAAPTPAPSMAPPKIQPTVTPIQNRNTNTKVNIVPIVPK